MRHSGRGSDAVKMGPPRRTQAFFTWFDIGMIFHDGPPYLEFVLGFTAAVSVLHLWLDLRQLRALRLPAPPPAVRHLYPDADDFKKKQGYQIDRLRFGATHTAWDAALSLAFLALGYYPATWSAAGAALSRIPWVPHPAGEVAQSVAWVLLLSAASTALGLPWSAWRTFVLESRHGFNKTSPGTFVGDVFKGLALTAVLAPAVVAPVTWILSHTGPAVAAYLWAFLFALSLVMMSVYPTLIAPLFNAYTPLPAGPLREAIEALAGELGFPLRALFVVDGSKRSAHSNAYMYGFFRNKRIVLYDTLIQQCSEGQIAAVLAHELGHWQLRHTPALFAASQAVLGAQLALFAAARGAPGLYESFGFGAARPALAALLLFQLVIGPVDEVLGLLQNVVSRRFEFQADAFAVGLGRGADLAAALGTLDRENKGPPNVDALYSAYHFSHPPLPERLAAIDAATRKAK